MCGLVGMAGDMTVKHRDMYRNMLFFNSLRGMDSTGVTVLDVTQNKVVTRKSTIPGFEFIDQPGFDAFLGFPRGVWLGHGRARTVGNVSRLNAHPFEVRDDEDGVSMFGAHNGTLRNNWEIEKLVDGPRYGTDSETLINLIAQEGAKKALAEATGAWALTWWHYRDGINLIRNCERPLCYALTEDEKVLIWASESWMIRVAAERCEVRMKQTQYASTEIWSLAEDTLYTWVIPKNGDPFDSPKKKGDHCGKPPPPVKEFPKAVVPPPAQTITAIGTNKELSCVGYEGEPLTRAYVEQLKKGGCDWCNDPIFLDDFAWLDDSSICCRRCLRGGHVYVDLKAGAIRKLNDVILIEQKLNQRGNG